jgi:hypothetical protein
VASARKGPAAKAAGDGTETPAALAKSLWALVTAVLGGGAGALALGPPTDMRALTTGLSVAVAALAWLSARLLGNRAGRMSEREYRTRVVTTLIVAGVLLLVSAIGYVLARDSFTAPCGDGRYIIGTELTEAAKSVVEAHGYTNPADLLMSAGCSPGDVWTAESLRRSTALLWTSFSVLVGALVFPVIFLWHVLGSRPRGRTA